MIFHENRLLADDSHVISYLIFVENWEDISRFSSAAVVIGALRANIDFWSKFSTALHQRKIL